MAKKSSISGNCPSLWNIKLGIRFSHYQRQHEYHGKVSEESRFVIKSHHIGINSPLAKVFGAYNPRSDPMTAATGAVRNSPPRPGLGG